MNLCIDCRFFVASNLCNREVMLDTTAPRVPVISPVDGGAIPYSSTKPTFSALLRRQSGDCGMDAKFFELKK